MEDREGDEVFEDAQEQEVSAGDVSGAEEAEEEVAKRKEAEQENLDAQLQKEDDEVKAELAKLGEEAAAASVPTAEEMEDKPVDPALNPPSHSRSDWAAEIESLSKLMEQKTVDEETVKTVHEALMQRIEDTKNLDEHKAIMLRRLVDAAKERDRCKTETQRALLAKAKLEGSCRELQTQKTTIAKENRKIAEEEQSRHSELKAKFEQAIKDVQEKMDAELEVRQHFLKENEELRGKLLKFTETYEAQEKQLAEQRESRESEMEVAQKRLEEHETMCAESKVKAASLEKHNETLRKSQTVLRTELQSILGKFDEFHEAVSGSNARHGECKVEIDDLQSKLQEYEKENTDLKNSVELSKATEEHKVAEKQRDALDRLCDNLASENRKLQEQLKKLRKK